MLPLHPLNSPADITDLNQQLNDIHTWLSLKSLMINPHKSKRMIFSFCSQVYFDTLHTPTANRQHSNRESIHIQIPGSFTHFKSFLVLTL